MNCYADVRVGRSPRRGFPLAARVAAGGAAVCGSEVEVGREDGGGEWK